MTTERVERRRTTVWRLTWEGCPYGSRRGSYLGCPYRVAGNPRRTGAPHGGRMAASCTLRMKRLVNIWIAAAVILLISIGGTAAQPKSGEPAAQPKRIVVLYSYGQNFQAWATWGREIRSELNRQSPWPLDIQEYSLVTARNGDEAAEAKFVEYLRALYAQRPPDLIVALAAPAARFVQRYRADLFPTTPMLLAAVEPRRVDPSLLSEQDAMVGVRFDPVVLVENILRLLPETKTIALINGNSPTERFWAGEMQRVLGPLLEKKVELIFYGERSFAETLKAVASLPPHSAIFFQQLQCGRRRCRLWRQGAIEAHLMRSPTLRFLRSTSLTLTARSLAARCFHRPRVPDRLLLLPSECWEERRPVASRFLRSNSRHRNTIGDNFSAGTSARAACHRGAKSCFGSQRRGSVIPGKSRSRSQFFSCKPG